MSEDISQRLGPGMWWMLHMLASEIETDAEERDFIRIIGLVCKRHPCADCRAHCKKYLENNSIDKYKGALDEKGNRVGMLKYTWALHNEVNIRLNKKTMDWDTCFTSYFLNKDAQCTQKCGSGEKTEEVKVDVNALKGNPYIEIIKKT